MSDEIVKAPQPPKSIHIGLCTIRNEELLIGQWATMLHDFCDRVVALVDPATSDHTVCILKHHFPFVEIEYQDRSLGDSDNETQGPTGESIMHANKTKWIRENIPDGEWFIEMAADESFHPSQWEFLKYEIEFAKLCEYDAIIHRTMYEPVNVKMSQLVNHRGRWFVDPSKPNNGALIENTFSIEWERLGHARFQKKYANWEQKATPHSGFQGKAFNPLVSQVPIWHFHRIKYNSILPSSWRDKKGSISTLMERHNGMIPVIPVFQFDSRKNINLTLLNRYSYKKIIEGIHEDLKIKAQLEKERLARQAAYEERKKRWPDEWKTTAQSQP